MRKKIYAACILTFALFVFTACQKNNNPTTEDITTEASTDAVPELTTQEATTEDDTQEPTTENSANLSEEGPSADKPKVDQVKKGTGVFTGLIDSHSVEIQLSDGTYETFFIYDEKVQEKLYNLDEGSKISFTYGPLKGQVNPQIISID